MPTRDYGIADLLLRRGQVEGGRLRDLAAAQGQASQQNARIYALDREASAGRASDLIRTLALVGTKAVGDYQDAQQQKTANALKQAQFEHQQRRDLVTDDRAAAQESRQQAQFDDQHTTALNTQKKANDTDQQKTMLSEFLKRSFDPESKTVNREVLNGFLMNSGMGEAAPGIFKAMDESDAANQNARAARTKAEEAEIGYAKTLVGQAAASDWNPTVVDALLTQAELHGHGDQVKQMRAMSPDQLKAFGTRLLQGVPTQAQEDAHQRFELEKPSITPNAQGLTPAQAAADARERDRIAKMGQGGATGTEHKSNIVLAMDGIEAGNIPPELPSRGTNAYTELAAEAQRRGFNLAKANQDWLATKKYLSTLNGAQQVRLRQAVEFTDESVQGLRGLIDEWKGGKFPLINKADLALARNGAYGQKAASIATRLEAQIADIQSELGTVYKGGNSSTDESLKLAAENLKKDWSWQVMNDAVDQIQKNLQYRRNSMNNVTASGVSEPNPYPPGGRATGAAPAPAGGGAPTAADLIKKYGGG